MTNQTRSQPECCNEETLREYWNGRISEELIGRIEAHVAECSECSYLLNEIEAHAQAGDLVQSLRVMAQNSSIQEESANQELHALRTQQIKPTNVFPLLPQQIGPYRLLEPLGQGGMATVFVAEHTRLQKSVALKLVRFPKEQPDARVRFEREMLATGKLNHPSIVSATDAGQEGDLQFLVMEHVRGMDLSRMSRRIHCFAVADVCEIGRQIAIALAYAHAQGFVHRDIKPSNVMLDENGIIKVLDFGLVMFEQWDNAISDLTTVGQFLGTLDYIAPEQAERSGGVDHRADLYSLGATLFRLLCGHGPLSNRPNATPLEKLRLLAHHRPLKLIETRSDAPQALCELMDQLLQTDPVKRPVDAAHVAKVLDTLCHQADLSALIRRAEASQDQVPLDVAQSLGKRPESSVNSSLRDGERAVASKVFSGGRNRIINWGAWILASCAGFVLCGIIIRWDTKDGQLVIESELSDGEIKIKRVDDGSEQSLKIETGNTLTKLRAGQYQLELASGSDSVSIENGSFVIATGKTVIARIRLDSPSESRGQDAIAPVDVNSEEPLYDGLPLSELLKLVRRESSYERWRVGVLGATTILRDKADRELFDELFGLLLSRQEYELLSQWRDPRVDEAIVNELEKLPNVERAALLRKIAAHFDLKYLTKTLSWIAAKHVEHAEDASDLFFAIQGIDLFQDKFGLKSVSMSNSETISLQRWVTLESMQPVLAHAYDDLAVVCAVRQDVVSIDYAERAASRLLRENRSDFGSRVWSIQRCLLSNKSELTELAEQSYSKMLMELRDAFQTEHKYRNMLPNNIGADVPGSKSPAIHFAMLASQFTNKARFEPLFHKAISHLVPSAQEAWEIYKKYNPGISVRVTMSQVWKGGTHSLTNPKLKLELGNKSESEFAEDSKSLLFLLFLADSLQVHTRGDMAPINFGNWCELMQRYGKDGGIQTAELDEESKDYLKMHLGTDVLPNSVTFSSFFAKSDLEVRKSDVVAIDPLRLWVSKRIERFDKDGDGSLDAEEVRLFHPNLTMSEVDLNGDGVADLDELVRLRRR